MSPFRRRRIWQLMPLLLCGAAALALLPAGKPAVNHVEAPGVAQAASKPAAATASAAAPAQPANAAPSLSDAAASAIAASGGKPAVPAPGVTQVAAVAPVPTNNSTPAGPDNALPSTADLSAPAAAAPPKLPDGLTDGHIGSSAVNVRAAPVAGSDKRFVASAGEAVKIGETNGNWVHVYLQDGTDGWVFGRYIAGHEPPPTRTADARPAYDPRQDYADQPDDPPDQVFVRPASADPVDEAPPRALLGRYGEAHSLITARVGPNGAAPPAFLLQPGDRFRISQSRGGWILIVTEDGMSGWIAS